MTLADRLPAQFSSGAFDAGKAHGLRHRVVVARYLQDERPWPGRDRFVVEWFVLDNGWAVGWNVNPVNGWTFPVIRYGRRDDL